MRVQGRYPVRRPNEGKFVLDGSKRSSGWQAFIPNDQNIAYKNPERAFISSANQYPVDNTYPYYITAVSWEAYRNRRINKVLSQTGKLAVADMMNLQNDNYNLKAEESLPLFLNYLLDTTAVLNFTAEEKAAIDILKTWDYYNTRNSEGASYYEAWWDNLMPLLWDELEKENVALIRPTTFTTIRLLKEQPALPLFDIQSTPEKETAREVVRKAFTLAIAEIGEWKKTHGTPAAEGQAATAAQNVSWGAYKDSYMEHLTRIKAFRISVETGGNHDIVNAHSQTHGPSWRMIVSLEPTGVKTWASYPGGQSGNMGSVHYSDILTRWVKGEYFQLLFAPTPEQAAGKTFATTILTTEEEL
jgi:penicillin amidase